jgi:hypothetical protein
MLTKTPFLRPCHDLLAARLINRDSGGLVGDRLGGDGFGNIYAWFLREDGADAGKLIRQQAPVFHEWLSVCIKSVLEETDCHGTLANFLFGLGLWVGTRFRAESDEGPFLPEVPIQAVIQRLSTLTPEELPAASQAHYAIQAATRIPENLAPYCPLAEQIVDVALTVSSNAPDADHDIAQVLFILGIVGSGVGHPSLEDSDCQGKRPS